MNNAGLPENVDPGQAYLLSGAVAARLMALLGGIESPDGSVDVDYLADRILLRARLSPSEIEDSVDTTQVDLDPDLQIAAGELQARAKKPYLDIEEGKLIVRAGDYGAWRGIPIAGLNLTDAGGHQTFCVQATQDSYDALLDDSIDWRDRIVESSIATVAPAAADPAEDARYTGRTGSAENLVTDGNYQLYVAANGTLRVSATSSTLTGRVIYVKASARCGVPALCPCPEYPPAEYPCGGLAEEYHVALTFSWQFYNDSEDCSTAPIVDCTKTVEVDVQHADECIWNAQIAMPCDGFGGNLDVVLLLNTLTGVWQVSAGYVSWPIQPAATRKVGLTPEGAYLPNDPVCTPTPALIPGSSMMLALTEAVVS
jgi:hypothetical protein